MCRHFEGGWGSSGREGQPARCGAVQCSWFEQRHGRTYNINKRFLQRRPRGPERCGKPPIIAQIEVLARPAIVQKAKARKGKGSPLVPNKGRPHRVSELLELLAGQISRAQDARRAHRRHQVRPATPPQGEILV